jgi:hypothetical protein
MCRTILSPALVVAMAAVAQAEPFTVWEDGGCRTSRRVAIRQPRGCGPSGLTADYKGAGCTPSRGVGWMPQRGTTRTPSRTGFW